MTSLTFISLSLFTFSNIFSLNIYFGIEDVKIPQILAISTISLFAVDVLTKKIKLKVLINTANISMLLIVAVAIYLCYNGIDNQHSQEIIFGKFVKGFIIYILISSVVSSTKKIIIFTNILVIGGFLLSYWITHYASYSYGRPYIYISHIAGDPNYVGLFLAITIPMLVGLIIISRSLLIKLIYIIPAFFILLGIVVTLSRGAFLALAAGVLFALTKVKLRKKLLPLFISLIIIIPISTKYISDSYVNRMMNIGKIEADKSGSSGQRAKNMLIGLNYIIKHPLSSYGPGNNGYIIAEIEGRPYGDYRIFEGEHIHCNLLQIGADLGSLPLVLYLLYIFCMYSYLRKSIHLLKLNAVTECQKKNIVLAISFQVSLVVFIVGAFFLPVAYDFHIFYLGGLCVSIYNISQRIVFEIGTK